MKFFKGVMLGGLLTTGIFIMHSEHDNKTKKRMVKKGKQFIKKMGII